LKGLLNALGVQDADKVGSHELPKHIKNEEKDYLCFTFVRNPF